MKYLLSDICAGQLKLVYNPEAHTSQASQWLLKVSICPLTSFTMQNCSQVKTLVRTTSMQMIRFLRWFLMVSDSLCRRSSVMQTHSFISCSSGWSQMIPQVNKPDVDWRGYTWSAVVRPWTSCHILENNVGGGV